MDNLPAKTPSCSPVPQQECPSPQSPVKYNWVDITQQFADACSTLGSEVLIKGPNFTLYEAMSAIEMMDPKMDSWMAGQKVTRKIMSLSESIEKNAIKLENFSYEELILLMDHCQACILSWLDGQSIVQTVFTFLYLHDPSQVIDSCLKAFCFGVLKLCSLMFDRIKQASVYEEEDFQSISYNFDLAYNLTTAKVISMLRDVEDKYGRTSRSLKSTIDESNKKEIEKELINLDGVLRRIKFLRIFLQAITPFGCQTNESPHMIKKLFNQMLEQLKIIQKTAPLTKDTTSSNDNYVLVPGFEPLLNQKLLPPTFPRYTKLYTISQMFQLYEDIIKRMLKITDMMSLTTISSVLHFIVKFSNTNPCVLTRSLAQLHFLTTVLYGVQARDVICESIRTFNASPCLNVRSPLYSNTSVKNCLKGFINQSLYTMVEFIQAYGHNYARKREKLPNIIENFSALKEHGDKCDTNISEIMKKMDIESGRDHIGSLSGWALYYTVKVMIEYITSGFVLQLYSNHELHYIYWYLCDNLLHWKLQVLNRAEHQLHELDIKSADLNDSRNKKSNKKLKKIKKKSAAVHTEEITLTKAWLSLGLGTFKAVLGFSNEGKFQTPTFRFDNEKIRYEHRFRPFQLVSTPPYRNYESYQMVLETSVSSSPTSQELFSESSKLFAAAKTLCEIIPESEESQKLLLVSKTNLIATKILASQAHLSTAKNINLDFSTHSVFPIIKIN